MLNRWAWITSVTDKRTNGQADRQTKATVYNADKPISIKWRA